MHRKDLGLALISCGVLALLISIWQYLLDRFVTLWSADFLRSRMCAGATTEKMQSPVIAIAMLLVGIGVFAFFAVLLRLV